MSPNVPLEHVPPGPNGLHVTNHFLLLVMNVNEPDPEAVIALVINFNKRQLVPQFRLQHQSVLPDHVSILKDLNAVQVSKQCHVHTFVSVSPKAA
jgi:hypothetical protein